MQAGLRGPSQWGWINSLFVNCSLAASWTTWRRFWMICRIVNYHSFSQTRGQAPLLDPLTSKPSSMTSCNSQLRTARLHLLEARKRHCEFHRAVSMRYWWLCQKFPSNHHQKQGLLKSDANSLVTSRFLWSDSTIYCCSPSKQNSVERGFS